MEAGDARPSDAVVLELRAAICRAPMRLFDFGSLRSMRRGYIAVGGGRRARFGCDLLPNLRSGAIETPLRLDDYAIVERVLSKFNSEAGIG